MAKKVSLATALHRVLTPSIPFNFPAVAPEKGTEVAVDNLPVQTAEQKLRLPKPQGLATDQFLYFFLRLRKGEVRRVVQRAQAIYPGETPDKLARRLVNTQSTLSFLGGTLLHLPQLLPVAGSALKFVGFAGGTSIMTRMHLYLILEIAHLYGHDIDDQARVPEMMAIVAASGLAATSPFLVHALKWHPFAAIPTSGLTVLAMTQLIGTAAIRHYAKPIERGEQHAALPAPVVS
jgi:hypothetical protein